MKIIASSSLDMSILEKEFSGDESGLVVFPEDCFEDVDLEPYRKITETKPVTIIGTGCTDYGYNLTHMIKKGGIYVVHIFLDEEFYNLDLNEGNKVMAAAKSLNKIYDVSPNGKPINAIIRECLDLCLIPTPPTEGLVDLLITSSNFGQIRALGTIKKVHAKHLKPSTLIVQSMDKNPEHTGVYDLEGRLINGVNKGHYKVYDLNF